jgi:hypothetical protein
VIKNEPSIERQCKQRIIKREKKKKREKKRGGNESPHSLSIALSLFVFPQP